MCALSTRIVHFISSHLYNHFLSGCRRLNELVGSAKNKYWNSSWRLQTELSSSSKLDWGVGWPCDLQRVASLLKTMKPPSSKSVQINRSLSLDRHPIDRRFTANEPQIESRLIVHRLKIRPVASPLHLASTMDWAWIEFRSTLDRNPGSNPHA